MLANPRPEATLCRDVHAASEELLKVKEESGVIQQGPAWFQVYEQVQVDLRPASPRATEPKTRTARAPCVVAMRRMPSLFALSSSGSSRFFPLASTRPPRYTLEGGSWGEVVSNHQVIGVMDTLPYGRGSDRRPPLMRCPLSAPVPRQSARQLPVRLADRLAPSARRPQDPRRSTRAQPCYAWR